MDKKTYKIERWDPVLLGGEVPRPMAYVKHDDYLKELLEKMSKDGKIINCVNENELIKVKVKGIDNILNDWSGEALLRSSANFPNQRPNFFEKTGYYCFVLNTTWIEAPIKDFGEIELIGVEPQAFIPFVEGFEAEKNENEEKKATVRALTTVELYAIAVGLIVFLGFLKFK